MTIASRLAKLGERIPAPPPLGPGGDPRVREFIERLEKNPPPPEVRREMLKLIREEMAKRGMRRAARP